MTVNFLRTMILYIVIVVAVRIMGKRQLGELSPTELVITILMELFCTIIEIGSKIILVKKVNRIIASP